MKKVSRRPAMDPRRRLMSIATGPTGQVATSAAAATRSRALRSSQDRTLSRPTPPFAAKTVAVISTPGKIAPVGPVQMQAGRGDGSGSACRPSGGPPGVECGHEAGLQAVAHARELPLAVEPGPQARKADRAPAKRPGSKPASVAKSFRSSRLPWSSSPCAAPRPRRRRHGAAGVWACPRRRPTGAAGRRRCRTIRPRRRGISAGHWGIIASSRAGRGSAPPGR